MKGRCEWCCRPAQDLVERPVLDDHSPVTYWCRDSIACQAARTANRPTRNTPRRYLTRH